MATVRAARGTSVGVMGALAIVAMIASMATSAGAQEQDGSGVQLRAGSGDLAPLPGQSTRREREGDRGDARLFHPSLGFDVPTRAELLGRASETLRVSRQIVRERERELFRARQEQRDYLEGLPEVRDAERAVREASAELNRARREVDRQLRDDEVYQEMLAMAERVDDMIRQEHRRHDTTRFHLRELAEQRLFYSERLEELRQERADLSAVEEAQQRLTEAVREREQVEAEVQEQLRQAPEIAEARDRLDEARQQHRAARIEYAGARAGYLEADRRQPTQTRIRRLQPVVHDPFWRIRLRGHHHGGFIIAR